jgi:hypothetical protein
MAISSGVGPHLAWVIVNGSKFLIHEGSVSLTATKKSGTFSGKMPLLTPGAAGLFAALGDNDSSIVVETRGQTGTLISGEIDDVTLDIVGGEISFSGRDASAKLHDKKTAEKWINKKPDEIITDLAGRVGLSTQIEPLALTMQRKMNDDYTKLSDNISYSMVVHKLSEFMGAYWYVQGSTLFVTITPPSDGYAVNYSIDNVGRIVSDCISLSIKRNIQAGKPVKVTTKSWHTQDQKKYQGENTISGNGTTKEYVYHLPNLTQEHVDQHSKGKSKDHARHEINVDAHCVGDPSISIAAGLALSGPYFAGTYKIDKLDHTVGMEGHSMTISAKGPAPGRS